MIGNYFLTKEGSFSYIDFVLLKTIFLKIKLKKIETQNRIY